MHNGFTFATRAPNGFSDEDVAVLRSIFPTLAALQEVLALQRVMKAIEDERRKLQTKVAA